MVYESHERALAWFESALAASETAVRRRAVGLLRFVDGPRRKGWLEIASQDVDRDVAAMATSLLSGGSDASRFIDEDLFESDFGDGLDPGDLEWEWEYEFVVAHGLYVPVSGTTRVWVQGEDDSRARGLAVLKACSPGRDVETAVPIMVGKRLVNLYTRSPRSSVEAERWSRAGRPGYKESRE